MKYGIFKEWFYFDDDNYTTEGDLSPCVGEYLSLEQAEKKLLELDTKSFREYLTVNTVMMRSLSHWIYTDKDNFIDNDAILQLAKDIGWSEYIKSFSTHDGEKFLELVTPKNPTDEQISKFISALKISFHKILPYDDVEKSVCAIINTKYLGDDLYYELAESGEIPWGGIYDERYKNWVFVNIKRKKYSEDIVFTSHSEAQKRVTTLLVNCLYTYKSDSFILRNSINDIAGKNISIVKEFIRHSTSFKLSDNEDQIILVGSDIVHKELIALLDLISINVYQVIEIETKINGKILYPIFGDHQTY